MTDTVSTRLPPDVVRALDALGRELGRNRSELLRDVIVRGLDAERLARALDALRARRVSLGRAAEMAGLPVTVFLDEVRRAGVLLDYDLDDLRHDLAWADAR